jgi:hypothetical protein
MNGTQFGPLFVLHLIGVFQDCEFNAVELVHALRSSGLILTQFKSKSRLSFLGHVDSVGRVEILVEEAFQLSEKLLRNIL